MRKKYSIFSLIKNAFSNNENWQKMWESPEPKKGYDVIIVGGGGHGLGTAYYLAKEHGIKNIAVISAITKSKNYIQVVKKLMQATQN